MLSRDEIEAALPPHLRSAATQELTDLVNNVSTDPEVAEHIRSNFISYTSVLKEGRWRTPADYLHAVAYVSYKLMGYNNQEAYARTFPQRYQALVARGCSNKDISAYVAAFSRGQLVNRILEQTLIPHWVLNQHVYQQAIEEQAKLMIGAKSELVRTQAANSILTHLKKPDKKEVELNIGVAETAGMKELRDMLHGLAVRQQQLIDQGATTREIAHQPLMGGMDSTRSVTIDGEAVEVTPTRDTEDDIGSSLKQK